MFDFVWRYLGYELNKDKRKEYVDKKIREEKEEQIYRKKCRETSSFSRCAIPKAPRVPPRRTSTRLSQKQRQQQKSYAAAVKDTSVEV